MLEWIKAHPLPAAGGALALFVIVYFAARRSSGGGSVSVVQAPSPYPSDAVQQASIAASAQMAQTNSLAQLSAQKIQADYNAAVYGAQAQSHAVDVAGAVATSQANDALSLGALQANDATTLGLTSANDTLSLGEAQARAALATTQVNDATQQSIANTAVAGQVSVAQAADHASVTINGQNQDTQRTQISAQAQGIQEQVAAETTMAVNNDVLQSNLAQTAAGVINSQTNATLQTNLATIDAGNHAVDVAGQVQSAAIQAETTLGTTDITTQGQVAMHGQDAAVQAYQIQSNATAASEANLGNIINTSHPSTTAIQALAGAYAAPGNTANSNVTAPNTTNTSTNWGQIVAALGKTATGLFGTGTP